MTHDDATIEFITALRDHAATLERLAGRAHQSNRRSVYRRVKAHAVAMLEAILPAANRAKKIMQAQIWLCGVLYAGPRPAQWVYHEGRRAGFSEQTTRRGLAKLGAVVERPGYQLPYTVSLPKKIAEKLVRLDVLERLEGGDEFAEFISSKVTGQIDLPQLEQLTEQYTAWHIEAHPTTAKPGTDERIAEYQSRVEAGLPLHHPKDADLSDREGLEMERYRNRLEKGKRLRKSG